ncbi:MAG: dehydrogenase, partial [Planctomycetaceae bacterium]
GNCLNVDTLRRDGSTYFATPRPDFLTANDAWFMPVAQKTGPDGCLYVLDWYDRYHCYQDARRDPKGIDRLKGRLYRIRYKNTPRARKMDLAKESDEQLIQRLHGGNGLLRRLSRRILTERNDARTKPQLRKLVFDDSASRITRLNALWALIGTGSLDEKFHLRVMKHKDATFRAWGVRAAGNMRKVTPDIRKRIVAMAKDNSPIVKREVAIASRKVSAIDAVAVLTDVLRHSGKDKLIPHIVWNNLKPLFDRHGSDFVSGIAHIDFEMNPRVGEMMSYVVDRVLSEKDVDAGRILQVASTLGDHKSKASRAAAVKIVTTVTARLQSGEIKAANPRLQFRVRMIRRFRRKPDRKMNEFDFHLSLLAASLNDKQAKKDLNALLKKSAEVESRRLAAARALIAAADKSIIASADIILADPKANAPTFRGRLLPELARLKSDKVADVVLKNYGKLEPELQPKAVELLTQRVNWSRKLLAAIGKKAVPANAINLNQARRLIGFKDKQLAKLVTDNWGIVRMGRDPKRAQYVATWKRFLRKNHGDAFKGEKVFYKVCGQCHKMYGKGETVGPDITRNGRNSFDQLLSNVFDPSLVIGSGYRAWQVATTKGRVITGLLVENSPQRIVLKVQGGKLETIARGDVDIAKESQVSMMPEDLEKQLKPNEIADLFAFITLDKHPKDKTARQLPGVRAITPRETGDPKTFAELVAEVLPGFITKASGVRGVGLLRGYRGRETVLRTHPVNRTTPCVLSGTFRIPKGKRTRLLLAVSHDRRGDWKLIVKANGSKLFETTVGPKSTTRGWADYSIDLSRFAGKTVVLELHNQPTGWSWEFGYWQRAELVSD